MFIPRFKHAAAEGSVLELKLRMRCEAVPAFVPYAHEKLADAEEAVVDLFGVDLSEDEKKLLSACRQLRNKVLHCDFRGAREQLKAAGISTGNAGVKYLAIDKGGDSAAQIKDALSKGATNLPNVSDTKSTREGQVFGWLVELGGAGDFERATEVFQRAVGILDRLAKLHSEREVA